MARSHQAENNKLVLKTLREQRRLRGTAPTVRELAAAANLPLSTVHRTLFRLREEGRITWEDGKSRTLRVVVRPRG